MIIREQTESKSDLGSRSRNYSVLHKRMDVKRIDQLVYKLYNLTEEEIKIVESR